MAKKNTAPQIPDYTEAAQRTALIAQRLQYLSEMTSMVSGFAELGNPDHAHPVLCGVQHFAHLLGSELDEIRASVVYLHEYHVSMGGAR